MFPHADDPRAADSRNDSIVNQVEKIEVAGARFLKHAIDELQRVHSLSDARVYAKKVSDSMHFAFRQHLGQSVPPQLQIEPTNLCNIECSSCSTKRARREIGFMPVPLFHKIIDDAARSHVKEIRLWLHGEPLLHPHFGEMVAYVKLKRIPIRIITNGSALSGRKAEEILSAGVNFSDRVTVSVLGLSREVHELVMKGIRHDKVVDNIMKFVEMRNQRGLNGPVVEVINYDLPENRHELDAYVEFWSKRVDRVTVSSISESFAAFNTDDEPTALRTHTCADLEHMWVFWNGDVTTCGQDINGAHTLGNLERQTISEIWNCEKIERIRELHRQGRFDELPFCRTCS